MKAINKQIITLKFGEIYFMLIVNFILLTLDSKRMLVESHICYYKTILGLPLFTNYNLTIVHCEWMA